MELGSEYNLSLTELTVKNNNVFRYLLNFPSALYFNSGRMAIRHLASHLRPGDEILLPEFICESVTNCLRSEDTRFYRLRGDFSVDIEDISEKITQKTRIIFLMHYFGALQPAESLNTISVLARENKCLILEDTTHSIFTNSSTVGDYQVCSLRKWLQIPNGGVLYAKDDPLGVFQPVSYRTDNNNRRAYGMVLKELFLRGELDCNTEYRKIFEESERNLDEQNEILLLSDFARFIASCVDTAELKTARQHNYKQLKAGLKKRGAFPAATLKDDACPFVLPLWVQHRDQFRAFLISNRIYCAVHWPFDGVQAKQRPFAKFCADNLISLPIDQRYGEKEISYLIEVIQKFGGELLF